MTESQVPPPTTTEASEHDRKYQWKRAIRSREKASEEEKYMMYNRIYVGQLNDEEDSNMDTNELTYTHFRQGHEQS